MADKVIPFRRASEIGHTPGADRIHPELIWDQDTGLYSLVYRGVEVYSRLDPVGRLAKLTGRKHP